MHRLDLQEKGGSSNHTWEPCTHHNIQKDYQHVHNQLRKLAIYFSDGLGPSMRWCILALIFY